MSDPSWFPSAVMQTVGALYGIFIAFFVLVLQSLNKYDIPVPYAEYSKKFDKKIDLFIHLFKILTSSVVVVELFNGALVYFVSDSIFSNYKYLLFFSYMSFAFVISYVGAFSSILIAFLISFIKKSPNFDAPDLPQLGFSKEGNYSKEMTFIPLEFIAIVFSIYMYIKLESHILISVFGCILLMGGFYLLVYHAE